MRLLANLIIISLMITMAGLSKATTGLVDPTRPATLVEIVEESVVQNDNEEKSENKDQVKPESIPDYRLNAIKVGRSSRMAIINGETVSPGQKVGSAMLVKINSGSVVMDLNGKAITVSLLPGSIKIRSAK